MTKRIIVVILLICTMCLFGCDINISGCNIGDIKNMGKIRYKNSETYQEYQEQVTINDQVNKVYIDWISGEVEIIKGDNFTITEENLKGDYYPLYWKLEDGILNIRYVKSGTSSSEIEFIKKKLVITCPSNLDNIDYDGVSASLLINLDEVENVKIDDVSGDINVSLLKSNKININNVSGTTNIDASELDNLDIDSVSGKSSFNLNKVKDIDIDTISGTINVLIEDTKEINSIDIDTTSADVYLKLNDERGYRLDFDTVSGKVSLEFSDGTNIRLSKYDIDVETISGDLTIDKLEK